MPKMKCLSLTVEKVKVDNRQTNRQTGQKQYALDLLMQEA